MKKIKLIIGIVCVLAIAGGVFLFFYLGNDAETETVSLKMGTLETTVSETGTVAFDDEYSITSMVSAKVTTADFEEGDTVTKDEVLYVLDSGDLEDQIEQTEVSLTRAEELLSQSENAESDLTLYAKESGLVTNVYVNIGDYVQPGTPVADIVETEYMKLTIPFSLPDSMAVYEGMSAKVVMTVNGAEVSGTVEKVYESGQSFEGGRQGKNIEIKMQNPGALKAGDTAYAEIGGVYSLSSGVLENYTQQTVFATQAGEIENISVREGDRVNVGTLIMNVKNDSITNAASNARINVLEIETTLSQLNDKLDDYVIKAPIDGVVITKSIKLGDIAGIGTPLAVVADTEKLYVNAEIDEMYIKDVGVGQRARVTTQNGEKREYVGTVRRINDSGIEKNGVTYYEVQIEISDTSGLIEGMNMDVVVVTGMKENAFYLPKSCVNGDKVTVLSEGELKEKSVETGLKTEKYVEITSGLDEDDKVVVDGGAL